MTVLILLRIDHVIFKDRHASGRAQRDEGAKNRRNREQDSCREENSPTAPMISFFKIHLQGYTTCDFIRACGRAYAVLSLLCLCPMLWVLIRALRSSPRGHAASSVCHQFLCHGMELAQAVVDPRLAHAKQRSELRQ